MRFKKSPQLPGAGRTRAWHHHGSHTSTSPGAILLSKMACQPKHFGRQCMGTAYGDWWCHKLYFIIVLYEKQNQSMNCKLSKPNQVADSVS